MDAENQSQFRVYYWLVRDGATGKVRKTRWRLSEKRAEALYPDAVRLEEDSILIQGEAPEFPSTSAGIADAVDQPGTVVG